MTEELEKTIRENNYKEFLEIISKKDDIDIENIVKLMTIYDHYLWMKNIPKFDYKKNYIFIVDKENRKKIIFRIFSSKMDKLSEFIENILDNHSEDDIINKIKKLPNYNTNNNYKTLNEFIVYHISGFYISLNNKYDNLIALEKIINFF
jgi:hypothetical protein